MTEHGTTQGDKSSKPKRPSVMALLLLIIGAWASIATSPAESSAQESGEYVIAADQPVVRLSWQSTSDKSPEQIKNDLWWDLSTETGAEALLSVGFPDDAQGWIDAAPVQAVDSMSPQGTVEFVVTNPQETGAVTMAWTMTARVEADQAELAMTVDTEAADRPSPRAALPFQSRSFFGGTQAATIYAISAMAPAGSAGQGLSLNLEPLEQVERPQDVISTVLVNGTANPFTQETDIPWPTDCAAKCELNVEVVMTSPPGLTVDSNDPNGSVTIITREPFQSDPVLVELGPSPALTVEQVFLLDVVLPAGDPIDRQVMLTAQMNDQPDEQFCSVPVSYGLVGKDLRESQFYLSGDRTSYTAALMDEGGELLEVRVGPASNPDECEDQIEDDVSITIGVITYGLTPPAQATVTVR